MPSDVPVQRKYAELEGKTFLICVGATKCATSWIHHYLGSSPEVAVSPLKELHFFNAKFPQNAMNDVDAFAIKRLQYHAARDGSAVENLRNTPSFQASVDRVQMIYDDTAYCAHFARLCTPETRTVCDITPAYSIIGREGFDYMKSFLSTQGVTVKLLFVMRDPVDRLWSQLRHLQQMNPDGRIATRWAEAIHSPRVMARADYKGTVTAIEGAFPATDILYLFYETLFTDESLRRLCDFAGAGYRPGDLGEFRNKTSLEMDLPDDAGIAFRDLLDPQYGFCRDRFKELVPSVWAP